MNIDDLEHWHFDLTEESANKLLNLVLEGKKRATSSSYPGYLLNLARNKPPIS